MNNSNHSFMFRKKLIILLFSSLSMACLSSQDLKSTLEAKEEIEEMKIHIAQSIKDRSPATEFEKNKKDNNVCFYSFGSLMFGYKIPGITKYEGKAFIEDKSIPVVNRFSDDPWPVFSSDAYWDAVVAFLTEYNGLVLKYLKESARESGGEGDPSITTKNSGTMQINSERSTRTLEGEQEQQKQPKGNNQRKPDDARGEQSKDADPTKTN